MFIVTINRDGLAVTVRKQISLPVTGALPLTGPVAYRSKTTLTGYRGLAAYRAWIQDPGSWIQDSGFWIQDSGSWIQDSGSWIQDPGAWIQDPGSKTLDPGSRVQDPGSRILDLASSSYRLPGILVLTAYRSLTAYRKAYRFDALCRLPKR